MESPRDYYFKEGEYQLKTLSLYCKFCMFIGHAKFKNKWNLIMCVFLTCRGKINSKKLGRQTVNKINVDAHVCWSSNHHLQLIVCWPRKTNFRISFPFAANKRKLPFSFSSVSRFNIYIYTETGTVYICYCFKWETENGSPGNFS